jgi:hypothetical protein
MEVLNQVGGLQKKLLMQKTKLKFNRTRKKFLFLIEKTSPIKLKILINV